MSQYWRIYNLDEKEMGYLEGGRKYFEIFYSEQSWLSDSLTIPLPNDDEWHLKVKRWLTDPTAFAPRMTDTGLLRLPNELLLEIILVLYDEHDLGTTACFACTCQRVLSLALEPIEKLQTQAPWAGGRLICVGDYADPADPPAGLLTQEEEQVVKEHIASWPESVQEWDYAYGGMEWLCPRNSLFPRRTFDCGSDLDRVRFKTLCWDHKREQCMDTVLFNLTTGQYVCADTVFEYGAGLQKGYNLSHAILYKIAWSRDPSGCETPFYEGDISRGEWAGHRFCIATMDRMPALPEGKEEWEDISEEVVDDLEDIWDP